MFKDTGDIFKPTTLKGPPVVYRTSEDNEYIYSYDEAGNMINQTLKNKTPLDKDVAPKKGTEKAPSQNPAPPYPELEQNPGDFTTEIEPGFKYRPPKNDYEHAFNEYYGTSPEYQIERIGYVMFPPHKSANNEYQMAHYTTTDAYGPQWKVDPVTGLDKEGNPHYDLVPEAKLVVIQDTKDLMIRQEVVSGVTKWTWRCKVYTYMVKDGKKYPNRSYYAYPTGGKFDRNHPNYVDAMSEGNKKAIEDKEAEVTSTFPMDWAMDWDSFLHIYDSEYKDKSGMTFWDRYKTLFLVSGGLIVAAIVVAKLT